MPATRRRHALELSSLGLLLTFAGGVTQAGESAPRASSRDDPYGGSGSAVLEPVPAAPAARSTRRLVFSCVTPGLVTFSDRPCGPAQQLYEVRLLPPHATRPGEGTSIEKPRPAAASRAPREDARAPDATEAAAAATKAAEHGHTCERLQEAVQSLDRRMRAGYSSSEAPRLWDRWRDAKEKLRQADC
jgi:hypothetical protein